MKITPRCPVNGCSALIARKSLTLRAPRMHRHLSSCATQRRYPVKSAPRYTYRRNVPWAFQSSYALQLYCLAFSLTATFIEETFALFLAISIPRTRSSCQHQNRMGSLRNGEIWLELLIGIRLCTSVRVIEILQRQPGSKHPEEGDSLPVANASEQRKI